MITVRPPKVVVLDSLGGSFFNPTALRCLVDSYPRARITWHRYNDLIGEGSLFHLGNITKRDQQGVYSYRIETDGYETIKNDFIIYMKGTSSIRAGLELTALSARQTVDLHPRSQTAHSHLRMSRLLG